VQIFNWFIEGILEDPAFKRFKYDGPEFNLSSFELRVYCVFGN